jgi:transposase-like protein
MVRREKKSYSDALKKRALAAYHDSEESVSTIAVRFGIHRDTFSSWVYRSRTGSGSKKKATLADLNQEVMKQKDLSPDEMQVRIRDLERALSLEKMRSCGLSKMIEIADRELEIVIRKNTGAKPSMR